MERLPPGVHNLPEPMKRLARRISRSVQNLAAPYAFTRVMQQMRCGAPPSLDLLEALARAWGNPDFAALPEFLREIAVRTGDTAGPVLECGSGLTTLVAGVVAAQRNVEVWALEHNVMWFERTRAALERWNLRNVHVLLAPLRDFGDFTWYDAPLNALPAGFSLIICDGPPGTTKGGRYGLVPLLRERFAPQSLILLDDASRPGERIVLERWRTELPAEIELRKSGSREYAIVSQGPRLATDYAV